MNTRFRLIWNLLGIFLDSERLQWQICTAKQSVRVAGCILLSLLFLCVGFFYYYYYSPFRLSQRTENTEANFRVQAVLVSKVRVCFWIGKSRLWPVEGVGERRCGAARGLAGTVAPDGVCSARALGLRAPSRCEETCVLSGKSSQGFVCLNKHI